jgi:anti-sigma B factor antagonist
VAFGVSDEAVDELRHVIAPEGEIDAVTAPQLGRRLLGLADEGKIRVVVDLSRVTFLDSTGLGVLLNALRALASRRGTLVLVCPNERALRPFQITGLAARMPIFASREAALSAV